jgi:hypothetical protein
MRQLNRLPVLEDIRIASPCSASWDDMKGDDRVRFCGSCEKNVYNLSAMPRGDAEALLREREGEVCVRLFRRADGTVITGEDCPVGVRKKRVRRAAFGVAGAGALAAAAFSTLAAPAVQQGGLVAPALGTNAAGNGNVAPPAETGTSMAMGGLMAPPGPAVLGSAVPIGIPRADPGELDPRVSKPVASPPHPTMGRVRRPTSL